MNLETMGWTGAWAQAFAAINETKGVPARVVREHRGVYVVASQEGEMLGEISGRLRHRTPMRRDLPAVGDWVVAEQPDALSRAIIHAVLPRRSAFVRRSAGGKSEEQVVASNVDTIFLVSGLDHDFNLRRMERYLTLAYESGAEPVIVLNKADLCDDSDDARQQTESIACGVPILVVSATADLGLESLREALGPGKTGALLGSSGVGKSTLVNTLLGRETLRTAPVRQDDSKGRHTTTHRELIPLPGGAILIDTPGMRELQLVGDDSSLARCFDEIAELAAHCRFNDCSHTTEPGCAVLAALAQGRLDGQRYESYLRQRKEMRHHQIEQDVHLQIKEKQRWKAIYRSMRFHPKRGRDA